ncbi:MAG: aminopeptidase P family N-terminal domain-containing protein, partial [candidate division Zixibacteria bacterium]
MSVTRIASLRKQLQSENLDGMIISNSDLLRYLSGYTGSNGLLVVTKTDATFFTDFRYIDQARKQVKGAKRITAKKGDLASELSDYPKFNRNNIRLGYVGSSMTVTERNKLQMALPDVLLVSADSVVAETGWVKEPEEIASIEKAAGIADVALSRVLGLVEPGVRENELAAELEYQMAMLGSEKPAFETILASGYRSAMP